MRRCSVIALAACSAGLLAPASADAARKRAPELTRIRCVPAASATCKSGVKVTVGRQLQLSGRRVYKGMRVSFRWTRGALATKLDRSRVGYVARVPPGTRAGTVQVTVSDRAGRRSNAIRITVTAPPRVGGPAPQQPGALPDVFRGNGMWIWQLPSSEGGDAAAIGARARASGISTVFVKSSDGASSRWGQFSAESVAALKAQGLRVCAWQYVYGNDPAGEAALGADAVADGADCLVIDAESEYKGKYDAAREYMGALRAAVGPAYPIGFTSFPYVDYHDSLPYSVFLGPGGANANLPQVYWKDIGNTVEAVSGRTLAQNRVYGVPIAPIGQTYDNAPPAEIAQFRSLWAAYGSAGVSWWSWQATSEPGWAALAAAVASPPLPPPDPGWPALARGNSGDQVLWLQQRLASAVPSVARTGTFDAATDAGLREFQAARGLPVTGTTDALTWQAVLGPRHAVGLYVKRRLN
ncbi:peptidoglycan-binding protein [Solirubrobacter sp. CPCC 204708]|uniref:Peptidoglycan-binding protein n=1 Tax=Solirubrobacter deserti TaxID=2282478 RepID=A0ABT4RH75_9ACTN|nr:peptidoglycan-binding domain-containing protein [Solirubrobacter deserti]MBE2315193.1 peptidoglycan-binding protein [Solirubrobacter deserti]MDA0137876.1 peptidoglycan-binding protein [Solirubrobacter deserti]